MNSHIKKVEFKKNIFPIKDSEYSYIDMHVHSDYSSDCFMSVEEIIRRAKKLNIGVSITDHNEIGGAIQAFNYAKELGVLCIPGIEIHCSEGTHAIFYFWDIEELEKFYQKIIIPNKTKDPFNRIKLGFFEVIKKKKYFKCLVCATHPYVKAFVGLRTVKEKDFWNNIDLIEVLNSCVRREANLRALERAEKEKLGIVGGSDGHFIFEVGQSLTKNKCANIVDFLNNLKDKNSYIVGIELFLLKTIYIAVLKEFRLLKKCLKTGSLIFRFKVMFKTFLPYLIKKIDFKLPPPLEK